MKRKLLLFSFIIVTLLIVGIVSAQICEVAQMREVLRKSLFDYLPAPLLSKLNSTQIKDLLDFYLNATNQTMVNCSIKANISKVPYEEIINRLYNLTANIIVPYCEDGTHYGQCSATKPKYCFAGQLVNRCRLCGCSSGQICQIDETAGFTINEGTWGRCVPLSENITCRTDADCPSRFGPYSYCQDNNVYGTYTEYKCLNPGTANSTCFNYSSYQKLKDECDISKNEYCFYGFDTCQLVCSDKTRYGQCSTTKPLYCENGSLINNCLLCGCPTDYSCFDDRVCRNILETGKTLTFDLAGKQTLYLKVPKDAIVKTADIKLISSATQSLLDIGNDTSYEWILNMYDIHEREWSGSCGEGTGLCPGGKFNVPRCWFFLITVYPLAGRINSVPIDETHVLIRPSINIVMNKIRLYLLDGFLNGMGVTTDASICRIGEENVSSPCSSTPIQLFRNYSLSNNIPESDWVTIPTENELTLSPGPWKIMFTVHYPNPGILPPDAGVGIKMCGYQQTGYMLLNKLGGKEYYETGSVYIQLFKEETSDFITAINNYLKTCSEYPKGYCLVPFVFTTKSSGIITISNVNITYTKPGVTCDINSDCGSSAFTGTYFCKNGSFIGTILTIHV